MSHAAILKLQRAGFSEAQVEALTDLAEASGATKLDLAEAVARIERRIDAVERRVDGVEAGLGRRIDGLEARIDRLGLQLTVRLGGMLVVAVGAIAALVKLL